MPLSFEEKARLGEMYERNGRWRKFGGAGFAFGGFIFPFVVVSRDFFRDLRAPDAGNHVLELCLIAFLAGVALAAIFFQAILRAKLRKRDETMMAFADKHFSEDCPWNEEASVLRQADELQREARASNIVAAAIKPKQA